MDFDTSPVIPRERLIMPATETSRDLLSSVLTKMKAKKAPPREAKPREHLPFWNLSGFHGKARIETELGKRPIDQLREQDKVRTRSGRFLAVTWIDRILLDEDFLDYHPGAHPILIRPDALSHSMPGSNLLLSPEQVVLVPDATGIDQVTTASELIGHPNVLRLPHTGFTYYRFHCAEPAYVYVEGVWCKVNPEAVR